jgi:tetratricopeptide (TPR) repeat protein
MVGPMSNSVSGPQQVETIPYGKDMNAMQRFARDFAAENTGKTTEIMRLVGFCLLIRKEVIDVIGGLDENYISGNFEDDDLCLRSFIAGYKNIIAHDVFIHHYGSMTFKGNAIDYQVTMNDNRQYFADKWKDIVEVDGNQYKVRFIKDQQIEKLLGWGEERFSKGNIPSAIKIFQRILQIDRTNSQALNNLGVIQWQLGDVVSAMETFQIVLSLSPKDPDALANLLQAAMETGRFDLLKPNLLDTLKQAQPTNPDIERLIDGHQGYV